MVLMLKKVCISLKLLVITYSSKKYVKENKALNFVVLYFTSKEIILFENVCRFLK